MNNTLKNLRLKAKRSQAEIAEVIGISQSQYAKYENNKTKFNLKSDDLAELAKYYGVTLDFLMKSNYIDTPEFDYVNNTNSEKKKYFQKLMNI